MSRPRSAAVIAYGGRSELTDQRLDLTVNDVDRILASVSNGAFEPIDMTVKLRRRPKSAPSCRPRRIVEHSQKASTARLDDDGIRADLHGCRLSVITPPSLPRKKKQTNAKKIPHYQTDCSCPIITELGRGSDSISGLDMDIKSISLLDKKKIKNDALKDEQLKIRLLEQKLQRESLNAALLKIQNKGMIDKFERGSEILSEKEVCVGFYPLPLSEEKSPYQIDNDWDKCFVASRKTETMERFLDEYEEKDKHGKRKVLSEHREASFDQKCTALKDDIVGTICKIKRKENENQMRDDQERNDKEYDNIEQILERLQISISKNQAKILQEQNFLNVANDRSFIYRNGDKGRGKENKKIITRKLENLILDTDKELSSKTKTRSEEATKYLGRTGDDLEKSLNKDESTRSSFKTRIRSINIHARKEEMVRTDGFISFLLFFFLFKKQLNNLYLLNSFLF